VKSIIYALLRNYSNVSEISAVALNEVSIYDIGSGIIEKRYVRYFVQTKVFEGYYP
jgi:hypothetical protein